MPQKPYKEYEPGFDPLQDAKDFLSRTSAPVPVPRPATQSVAPAAEPDDSLWGRVKRVAGWSPLPEDIGDQFAESVDPAATRGNDGWAQAKSFAAGTGKGFLDLLRSSNTPAGLATMGNPAGKFGRVAQGVGSAVFAGQGAEQALDDTADAGTRAAGVATGLMGLLGVHGAAKTPHPVSRTGTELNKGRFSTAASAADDFNADPLDAPHAPAAPSRHPVDLFDTPGFKDAPAPLPSPGIAPSAAPTPTATFLGHQDDMNGGSFPLYNIEGGPNHGSTVSAASLAEQGIAVPDAPPNVGTTPPNAGRQGPRPFLSAPEVGNIFKGRQKLAGTPDGDWTVPTQTVDGIPIPAGMSDKLDNVGTQYGRSQDAFKRLLGMPDADPAAVAAAKVEARGLGKDLRTSSKLPEPEFTVQEPASMVDEMPEPTPRAEGPEGYKPAAHGWKLDGPRAPMSEEKQLEWLKGDAARVQENYDNHLGPDRRKGGGARADGPDRRGSAETQARIQAEMDALDANSVPKNDAGAPIENLPKGEHNLGGEAGFATPDFLNFLARPVVGGIAGGVFGDEDHRLRDAGFGAALGAGTLIPGAGKVAERARYFSMLTGQAQAKNVVGNAGVGLHTAAERALTHGPKAGGNVLKEFFSGKTAGDVKDAWKANKPVQRLDAPDSMDTSGSSVLNYPFRAMGAIDTAAQAALKRGGIEDTAERVFTSEPKTQLSKGIRALQRDGGPGARAMSPFVKTGLNVAEAGTVPFADLAQILQGASKLDDAGKKQVYAKVALLLGGGAAGAAFGTTDFAHDHPKLAAFAPVAAGPAALPFTVAQQVMRAATSGKSKTPAQLLKTAGASIYDQLPLPSDQAFDPSKLLASTVVPAGLNMANDEIFDGVERDTSGGVFDELLSRLPGVSKTLPRKSKTRRRAARD